MPTNARARLTLGSDIWIPIHCCSTQFIVNSLSSSKPLDYWTRDCSLILTSSTCSVYIATTNHLVTTEDPDTSMTFKILEISVLTDVSSALPQTRQAARPRHRWTGFELSFQNYKKPGRCCDKSLTPSWAVKPNGPGK